MIAQIDHSGDCHRGHVAHSVELEDVIAIQKEHVYLHSYLVHFKIHHKLKKFIQNKISYTGS